MHIMIDLETLSTRPDAAIVQIGAVLFEAKGRGKVRNDKPFSCYVAVQDGGGSIDNGTLAWWFRQPHVATLGDGLETAVTLAEALKSFVEWPTEALGIEWQDVEGVWGKPSNFDIPVLQSAFARFGMPPPWDHRITRDARTLFALTGGAPEIDWTGLQPHHAFDDALGQAMQVQMAMASAGS